MADKTAPNPTFLNGVYAVWLRHMSVWKAHFIPGLCTNFISPSLFLFAFGFGLGEMVDSAQGMPYLLFVVPGVLANAAFFNSSLEGSIMAFSRFYAQKTYSAILASPVGMWEILWGEMLVAASKSLFSIIVVLIVAYLAGGIGSLSGAMAMLPGIFVCAMAFSAFGLAFSAYARGYESFNYFFALWVTPSFLFCGVFFEVTRFPDWLQPALWAIPMTHMTHFMRMMMNGMGTPAIWGHVAYVGVFGAVCAVIAHRKLTRRLLT